MDGPIGGVLTMLAVAYALFWLCLSVVLLVVGTGELAATARPGWRWPSLWAAAVVAGTALDALGLWAVNTTTYSGEMLAAILVIAPRTAASS
jgi:hypothetical protein